MRKSHILTIAAAVICLISGFLLGRLSSSPEVFASDPSSEDARQARQSRSSMQSDSSRLRLTKPSSSTGSLLSAYSLNDLEQFSIEEIAKSKGDQNPAILQLLISEWTQRDPEQALAFLKENGREEWIYHCITIYGRNESDSALKWIQSNTPDLAFQNYLTSAVYKGLAKDDPEGAIALIEKLPTGNLRNQSLYAVIGEWAEHDIESVFDWMETQEPSPLLSGLYGQTMNRYIAQSPQDAISVISEMTDNTDKRNFANQAAFELAKKDPSQALEWADTLNKDARHSARMGLMERWGQREDSLAALNYLKQVPLDSQGKELFSMLTMKMSHSSPDTLASEFSSLTPKQQELAAPQLARALNSGDPEKVITWLDTIEHGAARDVALTTTLSSLQNSNIGQAFELSTTLSNTNSQRNEMQKILLQWIPLDPEAAMAALDATTAMSESGKEAMRRNLANQAPAAKDYLLPAKKK